MSFRSHHKLKSLLKESNLNSNEGKVEEILEIIAETEHEDAVNTANDNGDTLLHILVTNNEWLNLKLDSDLEEHWVTQKIIGLIEIYCANREIKNNDGFTPLQTIINLNSSLGLGYRRMLLISLGLDAKTLDKNGNSLIHLHAETGNTKYIPYINTLINDHQIDINLKNLSGHTALQCLLNQKDFNANPMKVEVALEMIALGADINTKNDNGDTLFHLLVINSEWLRNNYQGRYFKQHWVTKNIKKLTKKHQYDLEEKNALGFTPLQSLMNISNNDNLGYKQIWLVDSGCCLHTLDREGNSLLHLYIKAGKINHLPFIKKLFDQYYLDLNLKNKAGFTPLECLRNSSNFTQSFANSVAQLCIQKNILFPSEIVIKQFEEALNNHDEDLAVDIFCRANDIHQDYNSQATILARICPLITKPVSDVFIIKLLEYEDRLEKSIPDKVDQALFSPSCSYDDKMEYFEGRSACNQINLMNISYLIYNCESVENLLDNQRKSMNLNTLIYHALDKQNLRALNMLNNALVLEMSTANNKFTPARAIVMKTCNLIQADNIISTEKHLRLLFNIIKKMSIYNRNYIIKCDRNNDILYSLRELIRYINKLFTKNVDEMILFVENERKKNHTYSKYANFFFHPESSYFEYPKDNKVEIARMIARTLEMK